MKLPAKSQNDAENAFLTRSAERHNVDVWRNGWPDFAVRDKRTGAVYAVEVKCKGDKVRESQAAMFSFLEVAGIPVFVWHESRPNKLTPWRNYYERGLEPRERKRGPQIKVVPSVSEIRAKALDVAMRRANAKREAQAAVEAETAKAPTTMREYADSVA